MKQEPAHLTLRPHHLLCIPHFTGHGYDAAFTENMTAVTELLAAQPETIISLALHCDDLCRVCPHNRSGVCDSQEKVSAFDRSVLCACGFSETQTDTWAALAGTVRSRILLTDAFAHICEPCEWYALCRNIHTEKEFSE